MLPDENIHEIPDLQEITRVVTAEDIGKHCVNVGDYVILQRQLDAAREVHRLDIQTQTEMVTKLEQTQQKIKQLESCQAACAVMLKYLHVSCESCKWVNRNSDEAACAFCGDGYSRWEAQPNPGQPILDRLAAQAKEIAGLKAAIEEMGDGRLMVDRADDGPHKGKWQYSGPNDTDWHGSSPTAAEAALAGLEATRKEQGHV